MCVSVVVTVCVSVLLSLHVADERHEGSGTFVGAVAVGYHDD